MEEEIGGEKEGTYERRREKMEEIEEREREKESVEGKA